MYDKLVKMYHKELSCFLKEAKRTQNSKQRLRHTKKPYWDENLSILWADFHTEEKLFRLGDTLLNMTD